MLSVRRRVVLGHTPLPELPQHELWRLRVVYRGRLSAMFARVLGRRLVEVLPKLVLI